MFSSPPFSLTKIKLPLQDICCTSFIVKLTNYAKHLNSIVKDNKNVTYLNIWHVCYLCCLYRLEITVPPTVNLQIKKLQGFKTFQILNAGKKFVTYFNKTLTWPFSLNVCTNKTLRLIQYYKICCQFQKNVPMNTQIAEKTLDFHFISAAIKLLLII